MKRNYPKNRKPNKESTTYKLLQKYTERELYDLWVIFNGMYKTSEYLSKQMGFWVTPWAVRYLSYKYKWVREVTNQDLPIYKGLLSGCTPQGHYKHIIFV
ncbi:MAG: hypothetical protein HYV28_06930 [Ignavibacteriales bacterium]|nr:hypothetical protein [Ignavibacteriales bacterium]